MSQPKNTKFSNFPKFPKFPNKKSQTFNFSVFFITFAPENKMWRDLN